MYVPLLFKDKYIVYYIMNNYYEQENFSQLCNNKGIDSENLCDKFKCESDISKLLRLLPASVNELNSIKIIEIACGSFHILFRSDINKCYGIGSNTFGELGISFNKYNRSGISAKYLDVTCCKILENKFVIKIKATNNASLFLTDNYECYACGRNLNRTIDPENNNENIDYLKLITINNETITDFYCSPYNHIYKTKSYKWFIAGNNYYGQFGYGTINFYSTFMQLPNIGNDGNNEDILSFTLGAQEIICLTVNNNVYHFGTGSQFNFINRDFVNKSEIITHVPFKFSIIKDGLIYDKFKHICILDFVFYKYKIFVITHDNKYLILNEMPSSFVNQAAKYFGEEKSSFDTNYGVQYIYSALVNLELNNHIISIKCAITELYFDQELINNYRINEPYYWALKNHLTTSPNMKKIIITIMCMCLKDKNGELRYPDSLICKLPRDILFYIFSFLPYA